MIGLLAGALIALRLELAPLALAAVLHVWWPSRRDPRQGGLAALGVLGVVVPYLVARGLADAPVAARALIVPGRGGTVGHLVLFVLAGGAGAVLAALVVRHPARRWLAIGAVLVAAGIATR